MFFGRSDEQLPDVLRIADGRLGIQAEHCGQVQGIRPAVMTITNTKMMMPGQAARGRLCNTFYDDRQSARRPVRAPQMIMSGIVRFTTAAASLGDSLDRWLHASGPPACRRLTGGQGSADAGQVLLRVLSRRGEVAAHDLGAGWSAPSTRSLSARVCSYSGTARPRSPAELGQVWDPGEDDGF
jgi:hypothetical protein